MADSLVRWNDLLVKWGISDSVEVTLEGDKRVLKYKASMRLSSTRLPMSRGEKQRSSETRTCTRVCRRPSSRRSLRSATGSGATARTLRSWPGRWLNCKCNKSGWPAAGKFGDFICNNGKAHGRPADGLDQVLVRWRCVQVGLACRGGSISLYF